MSEKFTVVGTTLYQGATKVRFANDMATRVKTLVKNGHTEIELFETPGECTKEEAVAFLLTQKLTPAALEAAQNKAAEYAPKVKKEKVAKAPKAEKPAKAKTAKVAKTAKAAPKAKKAAPSIAAKAKAAKAAATETIVTPVSNAPVAEDVPAVA